MKLKSKGVHNEQTSMGQVILERVMTYRIAYSGWTTVEVEADSKDEAESKFWDETLNELYDAEIGAIDVVEEDETR